jgi:hypothetical protein
MLFVGLPRGKGARAVSALWCRQYGLGVSRRVPLAPILDIPQVGNCFFGFIAPPMPIRRGTHADATHKVPKDSKISRFGKFARSPKK